MLVSYGHNRNKSSAAGNPSGRNTTYVRIKGMSAPIPLSDFVANFDRLRAVLAMPLVFSVHYVNTIRLSEAFVNRVEKEKSNYFQIVIFSKE